MFYDKELQKTNQNEFRVEKVIKRKGDKLYVKCKGYHSSLNIWNYKKDSINKWIFSGTAKSSGGRAKVELDLFDYATKADFKNATAVDTSKFAKKVDLANLKLDVDKLDIEKLKNVPTNLNNLKTKVDKLDVDTFTYVNLATNTTLNAKINKVKKEITKITNIATTTALNTKINDIKNKMTNISNLATSTIALTAVENKIPNVSNLVSVAWN